MGNCPFYSHQVPYACPGDGSCELDDGGCVFNRIAANPGVPATKGFFSSVNQGTEMTYYSYYSVARCNGVNDFARTTLKVPHDFSSIVFAQFIVICRATQAAAAWATRADYGAVGQEHDEHSEINITGTYNVTNDKLQAVDISGILSSLAANDYVGLELYQRTAGHNVDVLGVRFRYS